MFLFLSKFINFLHSVFIFFIVFFSKWICQTEILHYIFRSEAPLWTCAFSTSSLTHSLSQTVTHSVTSFTFTVFISRVFIFILTHLCYVSDFLFTFLSAAVFLLSVYLAVPLCFYLIFCRFLYLSITLLIIRGYFE